MITAYGFEQALVWLKGMRKVTRRGWNGQGMFIYLVSYDQVEIGADPMTEPLIGVVAEGLKVKYNDRIDMRYANGTFGIWSPSHEDILAHDWNVLV